MSIVDKTSGAGLTCRSILTDSIEFASDDAESILVTVLLMHLGSTVTMLHFSSVGAPFTRSKDTVSGGVFMPSRRLCGILKIENSFILHLKRG